MLLLLCVSCLLVIIGTTNAEQLQTEVIYPKEIKSSYGNEPIVIEKEQNYVLDDVQQPPVLNNPNYDPSMYAKFIPQDAVQQYVSSYGGPFYPQNIEHDVSLVQPPWFPPPAPYMAPYPIVPQAPYPDESFHGGPIYPFAVLPPPPPPPAFRTGSPFQIIKDLCPLSRLITIYYDYGAEILITACSVLLLTSAFTSIVCNFTSVCQLPFFPLFRIATKKLEKNDEIDAVENTLNQAIAKYEPKETVEGNKVVTSNEV